MQSNINSDSTNLKTLKKNQSNSPLFTPQLNLKNVPSSLNLPEILENYLSQYNYPNDYSINKITETDYSITFSDDSVAMNFTQYFNTSFGGGNILVYMELIPTKAAINKYKPEPKKKMNKETIEKLYLGLFPTLGKKKEKKRKHYYFKEFGEFKGKGNADDLMIKDVQKDKWDNPTNFMIFQGNKASVRKLEAKKPQKNPYIEPRYNFRSVDKNKWVSPLNFSI